jgi:hypothetical protein
MASYTMNLNASIPPAATAFLIRQHYSMVRDTMRSVRWLKRGCCFLLVFNIIAGLLLWAVKHPHTLGV